MLNFLTAYLPISSIKQQFQNNSQDELNRYISSKNPTSAADVDHWVREYDRKQVGSYWSTGV